MSVLTSSSNNSSTSPDFWTYRTQQSHCWVWSWRQRVIQGQTTNKVTQVLWHIFSLILVLFSRSRSSLTNQVQWPASQSMKNSRPKQVIYWIYRNTKLEQNIASYSKSITQNEKKSQNRYIQFFGSSDNDTARIPADTRTQNKYHVNSYTVDFNLLAYI